MDNSNFETYGRRRRLGRGRNHVFTGIFLLIIGGVLLAQTTGVLFPEWFFTWPMFLLTLGLFIGIRHNFRGGGWFILMLIGGLFLAEKMSDAFYLRPYFWPIIFIVGGIYVMLGGGRLSRRRRFCRNHGPEDRMDDGSVAGAYAGAADTRVGDNSDVVDITAIFSGVKKNVLSKNFKGGDITAIMGGAEINLTKADFQNKIVLDITNMFGGTKLIVPPDWDVQSQVVAIFGGVDDKRPPSAGHDPSKIIFLEGTCLFGGIEIRSF